MEQIAALLQAVSVVVGLTAVILALYVTNRLYTFKEELIAGIKENYVEKVVFEKQAEVVERLRHFKEHDYNDDRTSVIARLTRLETRAELEKSE